MADQREDPTLIAKTFVNMLAGIVSRDPTVALRAEEVDGAITVTLMLRGRQAHHYPHLGQTIQLEDGDSITFAVQGCNVGTRPRTSPHST